jgi:hypothetical protein
MATSKKIAVKNKRKIPPITIENAQLIFKNFSGTAKQFNAKGLRNFNVILDESVARMLEEDGWNVKWGKPKEDGDEPQPRLKVSVRFDNFPPRLVLLTKDGGRSLLDEDSVELLDHAEFDNIDIVITASQWETTEGAGVKAYLQKAFFTLSPRDLESKYAARPRHSVDDDEA